MALDVGVGDIGVAVGVGGRGVAVGAACAVASTIAFAMVCALTSTVASVARSSFSLASTVASISPSDGLPLQLARVSATSKHPSTSAAVCLISASITMPLGQYRLGGKRSCR